MIIDQNLLTPRKFSIGWRALSNFPFDSGYLARFLMGALSSRTRICRRNLLQCQPGIGENELRQQTLAVYRHFLRMIAEVLRFRFEDWRDRVDVDGTRAQQRLFNEKRGVLLATAHIGYWELLSQFLIPLIGPIHVVYRKIRPASLSRSISHFREAFGNQSIEKSQAAKRMIQILRDGGRVGILHDQYGHEGDLYSFFGRETRFLDSMIHLSDHCDVPVVPMYSIYSGDRLVVHFEDPIHATDFGGSKRERYHAGTQFLVDRLQEWAGKHPEQYFWFHRRWKNIPGFYD